MLRKHLGFIVFVLTATAVGVGARLVWDASTGRQDPPIWATLLIAVLAVPVAYAAEGWAYRWQGGRSGRGSAR